MNSLRRRWERRAEQAGDTFAGVLFQGLSDTANRALHVWHGRVLEARFLPRLPPGARVLDLGCGYGRLGRIVRERRPDIFLVGQDLALPYCRSYARNVAPAVQADLEAAPFVAGGFDGIYAVTALMYVEPARRPAAFAGLVRLLRPGGIALLLDPGAELISLLKCFRRGAAETAGTGFRRAQYVELARRAGLDLLDSGGNPRDSAIMLVSAGGWLARRLVARWIGRDGPHGGYSIAALHRWLLLRRPPYAALR
ncbi:MAG: class I SAM-dependent methyltransferase [Sinobacteraceae bacterium]|nr:class I SAM-dependent methyltransferase [Nevskiaceae bacterium]